ncbi:tRNA (adenine(37)-N6)-methyltransferase [Elysia marginata]|uniref:tRNA (Adenine(37)-N6)-methyltransferase n=1 Tax=Elysia marginata TaxID=1093978 RepID=A0AAV4F8G4_9GAST|nr:tRNA (adenine(37)-N6)-methyltransferase [Elysia marginata]
MNVAMKPIGTMKSLFHFKNGTPRQASICSNAPGVLTIEKSVFNNPEHSLEGLGDYSHAWVIFVFHKNNNSHTKAKVKPPRMDGRRTGVFSSRSPYRPNNIGLSLVKIDRIEGATVYFSGVDMIDGTPVLDIKPYIPEYDYPVPSISQDTKPPKGKETIDTFPEKLPKVVNSLALDSNNTNKNNDDAKNSTASVDELEKGFLAMSSALDKAGEILLSQPLEENVPGHQSDVVSNCLNSSRESGCKDEDKAESGDDSVTDARGGADDELDVFLEAVLSQAMESLSTEFPSQKDSGSSGCDHPGMSNFVDTKSESLPARHSSYTASCDETKSSAHKNETNLDLDSNKPCAETEIKSEARETNENEKIRSAAYPVVAPWLLNPPVKKLRVTFTIEALQQLQQFSNSSPDPHYRLQLLTDAVEAESSIRSVLREEPRSVYRRQHCQDSLYFFTVDIVHITCWFDEDVAQVVRVKPVATVSKLQQKLGESLG